MSTLPLFDNPASFDRDRLHNKLEELARVGVFIGTSSWKYEGWCGQIYTRERYQTRGRFSEARFAAECLAEYATVFPVVCGDFTFYQFPSEAYWRKLFTSAPATLQYALKVPEDITVKMFPGHPRYGLRAGQINESFLNAALFDSGFLEPLRPYRRQVAVLIFEFGGFSRKTYEEAGEFVAELDPFLSALPLDFRYAVEIRNEEFLGVEYFACLQRHGVAHVLNGWTRMPEIAEQMTMPDVYTADFTVARACFAGAAHTLKLWRSSRHTRRFRIPILPRARLCGNWRIALANAMSRRIFSSTIAWRGTRRKRFRRF